MYKRQVFADDGALLSGLTREQALDLARPFAAEAGSRPRYEGLLTDADQWTFGARRLLPLHRVALGDAAGTDLYLSDRAGEPAMKTTRAGRLWGYLGAVPHWLYFTPLRRHSTLWTQSILVVSVAGCLTCLSGLVWGLWRLARSRRYRFPDAPSRSPYAGLMRWHHYAGLAFGCVTFTWVFSGLLSMNPGDWSPDTAPTAAQQEAVAGGPLDLSALTLERLRAAAETLGASSAPRELEVVPFAGELHLLAVRTAATDERLVPLSTSNREVFAGFDRGRMAAAAQRAMPDSTIDEEAWLDEYDAYYYDRSRRLPLPVLRVRYRDVLATWLYLDPRRGAIVHKEERRSRLNRWLYHGLHSLDFPILYYRRPLWDVVVVALSAGGLLLSGSAILPAARRLRRRLRQTLDGKKPPLDERP